MDMDFWGRTVKRGYERGLDEGSLERFLFIVGNYKPLILDNKFNLSNEDIQALADLLDTTPKWLLTGKDIQYQMLEILKKIVEGIKKIGSVCTKY